MGTNSIPADIVTWIAPTGHDRALMRAVLRLLAHGRLITIHDLATAAAVLFRPRTNPHRRRRRIPRPRPHYRLGPDPQPDPPPVHRHSSTPGAPPTPLSSRLSSAPPHTSNPTARSPAPSGPGGRHRNSRAKRPPTHDGVAAALHPCPQIWHQICLGNAVKNSSSSRAASRCLATLGNFAVSASSTDHIGPQRIVCRCP
jgi:hypothetical protein